MSKHILDHIGYKNQQELYLFLLFVIIRE